MDGEFMPLCLSLHLQDLGKLSENLPSLTALNLSNNLMGANVADVPLLKHLRVLVLNNTGISWSQVLNFSPLCPFPLFHL